MEIKRRKREWAERERRRTREDIIRGQNWAAGRWEEEFGSLSLHRRSRLAQMREEGGWQLFLCRTWPVQSIYYQANWCMYACAWQSEKRRHRCVFFASVKMLHWLDRSVCSCVCVCVCVHTHHRLQWSFKALLDEHYSVKVSAVSHLQTKFWCGYSYSSLYRFYTEVIMLSIPYRWP